jgi:hypothetical protein
VFAAGLAQHFCSVAGGEIRSSIRQGQYRMRPTYSSPKGWRALLDPQLWMDHAVERRSEFALKLEAGTMLSPSTGVWLRPRERQLAATGLDRGGGIRFGTF